MESAPRAQDGGPSRLLALGVVAAGVALTALFLAVGFPAERLLPRLRSELAAASGAQVRLASLDVGLSWGGPVLSARDVELRWPDGGTLAFDRASLRPAWSFDWLRGVPAWKVDLAGDAGGFRGVVASGERARVAGELRAVVLERVPPGWSGGAQFSGLLDAEIDLARIESGWSGDLDLRGRDGSFVIPALPIGVPFQQVDAALVFGDGVLATLESFVLDGPMIAGRGSGSLGPAPSAARAPLQLELELEVRDPNFRSVVQQQGLVLDAEGRSQLRVGGTLGAPVAQTPPARGRGGRR